MSNNRPIDEALVNQYRDQFAIRVRDALSDHRPASRERSRAAIESCLFCAASIVCSTNGIRMEAVAALMEGAYNRMIEVAEELKECN